VEKGVAAPFGFEREGAVGLLLLMQGRCWRAENGRGYGRKIISSRGKGGGERLYR